MRRGLLAVVVLVAGLSLGAGRLPWQKPTGIKDRSFMRWLKTVPAGLIATGAAVNGTRAEATTVTRSTSQYCDGKDGTGKDVGVNSPCVTRYGFEFFPANNNRAKYSDEFDNAAWTKSGATVTANSTDVTDPFGTNTADKITFDAATAPDAVSIIYQTPTAAGGDGNNAVSVMLRTLSGTATVWLSCTDLSSYWYTRRADVTTAWTRFSVERAGACARFSFGVDRRDSVQPSTPSQTVYAIRAHADDTPYAGPSLINATGGTALRGNVNASLPWPQASGDDWCVQIKMRPWFASWQHQGATLWTAGTSGAANSARVYLDSGAIFFDHRDNSNALEQIAYGSGTLFQYKEALIAACVQGGTLSLYNDGSLIPTSVTSAAGSGTWGSQPGTLRLGDTASGAHEFRGELSQLCVGKASTKICRQDTVVTNTSGSRGDMGPVPDVGAIRVATLGDSITAGMHYVVPSYPQQLQQFLGAGFAVTNHGIGGDTAAQCLTNWTNNVKGKGYDWLVLMCGVNSITAGVSGATAFASLQTILDEARAEGLSIVVMSVTPWKDAFSLWTSGKQAAHDTLNASLASYASTYSLDYVDAFTALENPGAPDEMLAIYDFGDHLHPDLQGAWVLAQRVAAKIADTTVANQADMRILPLAGYVYTEASGAALVSMQGNTVTTTRAGTRNCVKADTSVVVLSANQPCVAGSPLALDTELGERHEVANPFFGTNPSTWCVGGTLEASSWPQKAIVTVSAHSNGYGYDHSNASLSIGGSGQIRFEVIDGAWGIKTLTSSSAYSGSHSVIGCSNAGTLSLVVDSASISGTVTGSGTGQIATQPSKLLLGHQNAASGFGGKVSNICAADVLGACP